MPVRDLELKRELEEEIGEPSADAQTIYDILANADIDGLTTQGNSLSDRIKGNIPSTLKRESALFGWQSALTYTQPDRVATSTTGGGSVTFGEEGAEVKPGTTAGDVARLKGYFADHARSGKVKTAFIFYLQTAPPYTNEFEMGWMDLNVNQDIGAYIDLTSEEYHAGTTTQALPSLNANAITLLEIEIGFDVGETEFHLKQPDAGVDETVTLSETNRGRRGMVISNSNGASEAVRVFYAKQVVIP